MTIVETTLLLKLPATGDLRNADFDRLEPLLRRLVMRRRPLTICEAINGRGCLRLTNAQAGT